MRVIKFIPILLFIVIITFLIRALSMETSDVSTTLINQSVPNFYLPDLIHTDKTFSQKDLLGHVSMLNVWASWCNICRHEHSFLMSIATTSNFKLYGLNYRDNPEDAKMWLQIYGNPYMEIGMDVTGSTGMDFGVYGTPETFIIDKKGVIRYKQSGEITQAKWDDVLKPLIDSLAKE